MTEIHQVHSPSRVALGPSGAWRHPRRIPKDFRWARRKLTVGAGLIVGDLIAGWLTVGLMGLAMHLLAVAPVADQKRLPIELLVLVFLTLGLYFGAGESPFARFRSRGMGIVLFVAIDSLAMGGSESLPLVLAEAACMAALLLVFGFYLETFVRQVAMKCGIWAAPTAIVGCGPDALRVYQTLIAQPELGFNPVGFVTTAADEAAQGAVLPAPIVGTLEAFTDAVQDVEVAIMTSSEQLAIINGAPDRLPPALLILVNETQDIQTLWLRTRALGNVVGIQFKRDPFLSQNRVLKRAIDLAIAVPAGIVALPVIAVLALLIRMVDGGLPFYVQPRVGRRGQPINVPKLRTMYHDDKARLEAHLSANPEAREEWERFFKLTNDPRILPVVGNFIRRTSLDELPQLWSVIIGDMSLVGPRPFPQYHMNSFDPEFRYLRTMVPPGLTGLWQVSARSDGDLGLQRAHDTFYIRNWSIWLDLYILFQTLLAVMSGKGAK